jgi:catechol 2,3-dioxygenase-like lactoylglutathione lyase family enzyme
MKLHQGRLIDHVHLRAGDLSATTRFYAALLDALGLPYVSDERHFQADELWIDARGEGRASHVHLAFQARDRDQVAAWHAAGLAAGGTDNGAPGERPYHPGYFAAFLLDPDGNNVEAVHHGPSERSAASVEVGWGAPS